MRLYEILLPFALNDAQNGDDYSEERKEFLARVALSVGGYTLFPNINGYWRDGAREYRERMIPVRVACESTQWADIVTDAMDTFADQKSILWYVLADEVTFATRKCAACHQANPAHKPGEC